LKSLGAAREFLGSGGGLHFVQDDTLKVHFSRERTFESERKYTDFGTGLDVAWVDEEPEAAVAFGAAEWNFSGETGAKKLQEISAMRAKSGVGSAMDTH
jgi:hypothetical protein